MKHWRGFLALIVAAAAVCALSLIAPADFGDFSGDTDFGGGDSDWGGGDWDSDWDSGGGGVGLGIPVPVPVGVVIAIIVVVLVVRSGKSGGKSSGGGRPHGAAPTPASILWPMAEFQTIDPGFSEAAMTEKISNLYVQFQNSWQNKDLTPCLLYTSSKRERKRPRWEADATAGGQRKDSLF